MFWICIAGAAAAVLASSAYLAEIDSLHGILELAAPGTVLPSEPVRSIPTRHDTLSMVGSVLSTCWNECDRLKILQSTCYNSPGNEEFRRGGHHAFSIFCDEFFPVEHASSTSPSTGRPNNELMGGILRIAGFCRVNLGLKLSDVPQEI